MIIPTSTNRNTSILAVLGLLLIATTVFAGTATPSDSTAMDDRLKACAACHGERGHSDRELYYPSIAGKPSGYIYQQLLNFRGGRRHNEIMQRMLANLSEEYLHAIARYYAAEPITSPTGSSTTTKSPTAAQAQRAKQLVEHGDEQRDLPACVACHGAGLAGATPTIPGLLGLPEAYIQSQLGAWRVGTRNALAPDCMQQVAQALTPDEIAAIAKWLARGPIPKHYRPAASVPDKLPLECGAVTR